MNIRNEPPPSPLTPEQSPTRVEGTTPRSNPLPSTPQARRKLPFPPLAAGSSKPTATATAMAIEKGSDSSSKTGPSTPQGPRSLLVAQPQREKLRRLIAQDSGEFSAAARELKQELNALAQAREQMLNEIGSGSGTQQMLSEIGGGTGTRRQSYDVANDSTECYCDYGEHFLEDY